MTRRSTLFRLLKYYKRYIPLVILVFILVAYSSFANITGTFLLKDVINQIGVAANDPSNKVELEKFFNQILRMCLMYGLAVLSVLIYNQITIRVSQRVIYRIRNELIEHIEKVPASYFDKHKHGEIMSFFTNDVSTMYDALNISLVNIVFNAFNIIGTMICLFMIDFSLTLIVIIFMGIQATFIFINSNKTQKYFKETQKQLGTINAIAEENVHGFKEIKAFNHFDESMIGFKEANENLRNAATTSTFRTAINAPILSSISYFNFAISSVIGCIIFASGHIDFGSLSSYLVYVRQSSQPFNFFTSHINRILTCLSASERIFKFLDTPIEENEGKITLEKVFDNENETSYYAWKIPIDKKNFEYKKLEGNITFKHVYFSYYPGKEILKDINFEAKQGQRIAFVGSTGAGKTTIISLILRFYKIDKGEILYDGINIYDIELHSLRKAISTVTQDTHLFTGTIKENIKYARQHSNDFEIEQAAKVTNADSFITRLPKQYNTYLYDDAHNLSDGQRQLLALARAAIYEPPLLILDEATSNIDTHTEKLVNNAMDKIMENRTVLVIAHRLSTVKNCDKIIFLEKGQIKEKGTHEELLKLKKQYYDLYKGKKELS